ncbi:MAG TPA: hypothetical protein VFK10_04275 [Burkholderiaceae bacterium]|nr:hypothetical protein [Burkholderiaceae bacterium]
MSAAGILCSCATPAGDVDAARTSAWPQAQITPIPVRIGVHFSEAFRSARGETRHVLDGTPVVWTHETGADGVEVFRQALRSAFAELVELPGMPPGTPVEPTLTAILVPSVPVLRSEWASTPDTWRYTQAVRYALALRAPTGEVVAQWSVEGTASVEGYADAIRPLRQRALDQAMRRNAGAALIASLERPPALAALRPAGAEARAQPASPQAAPVMLGLAVFRLDTGMSDGDPIERWVAHCLSASTPRSSPTAGEPSPGAVRDAVFPWFEPGILPRDTQGVQATLDRPLLQDRLRQLDISHLLLFTARRARVATGATPIPTPYGVFGPYVAQISETIDATVWDVAARLSIAQVETTRVQTTRRLGDVLPIPVVSSNESQVCARLRATVRDAVGASR